MVAHQAPSPLPSLSPEDSALISRLIELGEDLFTLAKEANRDFCALLAWTLRPDISPWLELARAQRDRHLQSLAQNTLAEVARTSNETVEKRRAASTLLRAFTRQWPRPERTRNAQSPPSPARGGGGGAEPSEAEGAPSPRSSPPQPPPRPAPPTTPKPPTQRSTPPPARAPLPIPRITPLPPARSPSLPITTNSGLRTQHSGLFPPNPLPDRTSRTRYPCRHASLPGFRNTS